MSYYTWSPKKEQLETRTNNIKNYLAIELSSLNADMIRSDIPTISTVEKVQIWTVDKIDGENYHVLFSVSQSIDETKDGKATNKTVNFAFKTTVHVDDKNNLVVTQNPTMSSFPTK